MHEQSEKFSKERILKKKKKQKQKFYLWEMQKLYWRIQKSFKSKLNYVEESAGNPEDNTVRGTKRKMSEESIKDLWDTMKRNNICIMRIPEGQEKEKWTESIFKAIIAKKFPNLGREMDIPVHGAQKSLNRLNLKRATIRHIIIKTVKEF